MVIVQLVLESPTASVTFTVKVPGAEGVPVTAPSLCSASAPPATCPRSSTCKRRAARDRHRPAVKRYAYLASVDRRAGHRQRPIDGDRAARAGLPTASVTLTEKLPDAVGVPVTSPVEVFSLSPGGSVPTIEYV